MSGTEFSEGDGLPDGWVSVRLADVLSEPLVNGRSVRDRDGGFPVLRLTAIKDGWIDLSESKQGAWTADEAAPFCVAEGDFLLSRGNGSLSLVGRGGAVGTVPAPVAFPDTMIRVRPDGRVLDSAFLRLIWQSPMVRSQIESRVRTTAGIYKLNQKILEDINLLLPPLGEQERIVEALDSLLSRLDAAQASLSRSTRLTGSLWSSVANAVATGKLEGREVTAEITLVEDVAEVSGGIQKQRKRAPVENHYPFLRVANVGRGTIQLDEVHRIELFPGELERHRLQAGDLLVVEGNGSPDQIGRAATWHGEVENAVHQNHLIRVRPGSRLNQRYFEIIWNSPLVFEQLREVARSTSGLYTLSTSKIKSVRIPVPSLEDQEVLAKSADNWETYVKSAKTSVIRAAARSRALRSALLRKAFSGRLVPQHPDDEPSAAVLDRIRVERAAQPKPKRTRARKAPAARKAAETAPAPEPTEPPCTSTQQELPL